MLWLLDLCCCVGGGAVGYYRAGFRDITGVDLKPMPRYPFKFVQGDALEYLAEHGQEYDAIHASFPCQGYSKTQKIHGYEFPKLIGVGRELLKQSGKLWVMENVPGAPMVNPVLLCGTMFGLKVIRHRLFETNFLVPAPCHSHEGLNIFTHSGHGQYSAFRNGATYISVAGKVFNPGDGAAAMRISWMKTAELTQAIPPVYTTYIGRFLLLALGGANLERKRTEKRNC